MNDRLAKIWNNPTRTPLLIGFVTFNVGFTLGYILGRRHQHRVEVDFKDELKMNFNTEELATLRDISERNRTQRSHRPKPVIKNEPIVIEGRNFVEEIIKDGESKDDDEELVTKSIFVKEGDEWDYEKELSGRSVEHPYVIHKDEFYSEESGYTQSTLTYYAGDNILVDEDEAPIYNHEQITGPLLFGHGSGDPNTVHIRNDKRRAEYEIVFDPGLYSVEVLGLEIEDNQRVKDLKHSRNRKFRPD